MEFARTSLSAKPIVTAVEPEARDERGDLHPHDAERDDHADHERRGTRGLATIRTSTCPSVDVRARAARTTR